MKAPCFLFILENNKISKLERQQKMELNCNVTKDNKWFRYRAAAIIVEEGCVLFAGNELDNYFYSVGGAVHIGETAENAVVREVYEETGVHYETDRLAVIHENFFCGNSGAVAGLDCHEICLYYLMKPKGYKPNFDIGYTQGVKEEMHWIPIADLEKYRTFPAFLKEYLSKEHCTVVHIVSEERN